VIWYSYTARHLSIQRTALKKATGALIGKYCRTIMMLGREHSPHSQTDTMSSQWASLGYARIKQWFEAIGSHQSSFGSVSLQFRDGAWLVLRRFARSQVPGQGCTWSVPSRASMEDPAASRLVALALNQHSLLRMSARLIVDFPSIPVLTGQQGVYLPKTTGAKGANYMSRNPPPA
jgi:hypothetical protein